MRDKTASGKRTTKKGRRPDWPRIRRRGKSWLVDCAFVFGERERRQFENLNEAEDYADAQRKRRETLRGTQRFEDENRSVKLTNLTDAQRMDVLKAMEILTDRGSLTDAARFWVKQAAPAAGSRSLREVYDEYLKSKIKAERRPGTIRDVRTRLGGFILAHAKTRLNAVTTADVEEWIDTRKGRSVENRDGYRRAFVAFFNYAVKRGYREGNPAAVIEVPKKTGDHKRIAILTPAEVARLLKTAATHAPELVPYFAIGVFAGLRPENELAGLDWRNVDFHHKTIHVEAASAKTRRERYVDMSDNLVEWLTPYRKDAGRIAYSRSAFDLVRERAGLIPRRLQDGHYVYKRPGGRTIKQKRYVARAGEAIWKPDVMRHTFASYHLAAQNDAGKTAAQLGHGAHLNMLFQHYRRAVRTGQAIDFWAIRPPVVD